ncbi:branched-chain amino acid ABC transporter permease [Telmatospirillum siberiense]|uniref:Branched-chain amino acid ABC transporter permease n=1 Tax=Telmatospirillum siberiense TaxID=382514 RepID=A0A2N3PNU8_9PROT|nr:branched-chain amino acid ABC transporter permease [Telmatospirillum siberiense]PKU22078.1 branched-chain amino acid ABC transporter permease [Telmatospirillum siberiense]
MTAIIKYIKKITLSQNNDSEIKSALLLYAVLAVAPWCIEDWQRGEFARYFSYMLLAASVAWVWGHCGILCFCQALFFGMGAYAMGAVELGKLPFLPQINSMWMGLLLSILLATLTSYAIGRLFFSVKAMEGPQIALTTLAIGMIAENALTSWRFLGGENGLLGVPSLRFGLTGGPETNDALAAYLVGFGLFSTLSGLLIWIVRSRWGKTLRAIRNNGIRAEALGINVVHQQSKAFALGAVVAATAGAFFVTQFGFASPSLVGPALSTEAIIWVALGGKNLIVSACGGALLVRLAESWLTGYFEGFFPLVLGTAFLLVVVRLPRGVIGELLMARRNSRHTRSSNEMVVQKITE